MLKIYRNYINHKRQEIKVKQSDFKAYKACFDYKGDNRVCKGIYYLSMLNRDTYERFYINEILCCNVEIQGYTSKELTPFEIIDKNNKEVEATHIFSMDRTLQKIHNMNILATDDKIKAIQTATSNYTNLSTAYNFSIENFLNTYGCSLVD